MKNKILILFLLISFAAFGQSVPNTNTFTLKDVSSVVGGTSLTQCFSRSVDADFDAAYKGLKDRLSNFRNYTIPSPVYTSGKWITAVVNGGYIWRSNDYGNSWLQVGTSQNWWGVSMDTTGMYQGAVVNNGYIYESNDFGVIWSQKGTLQSWAAIAVSGDGTYQTAVVWGGYIYTSSDYGATWTQRASNLDWKSVDVSPSGQYQIAAVGGAGITGYVYISTDYGVTWTAATGLGLKSFSGVYVSLGATIYYAVDGNNGLIWHSVAVDSTWHTDAPYYYEDWRSISGDYSGKYMIAGTTNGYTFYQDSTGSWNPDGTVGNWALSSGYTGDYMVAVNLNGYLLISTDYGVTWTVSLLSAKSWAGVATN